LNCGSRHKNRNKNQKSVFFQFPLESREAVFNLLKSREYGTSGYNIGKQVNPKSSAAKMAF
jgi:hypothetical protein